MTHGSLFSGIGGFDLAAQWMGWRNVFHCEINSFGQKILKHYWPNSISYNDITKTDFTIHRGNIDILSGGFPCQPYSMAGKRLGKEDERHLWPEMLRAIREIQPSWVVGENVFGIVNWSGGLVFHEVQADLEAAGYQVQPYVLPAAAVGAPHRRDRVWFVAYSRTFRLQQCKTSGIVGKGQEKICGTWNQSTLQPSSTSKIRDAADTEHKGLEGQHRQWDRCSINRSDAGILVRTEDKFNAADTQGERYESFDKDRTTIISASASSGLHGRGSNSIYKSGAWSNFPTQPPVCGRNDGISNRLDGITIPKWRNESIKGYGNAVVPQVVYAIFKTIEEYEQHKQTDTMGDRCPIR